MKPSDVFLVLVVLFICLVCFLSGFYAGWKIAKRSTVHLFLRVEECSDGHYKAAEDGEGYILNFIQVGR